MDMRWAAPILEKVQNWTGGILPVLGISSPIEIHNSVPVPAPEESSHLIAVESGLSRAISRFGSVEASPIIPSHSGVTTEAQIAALVGAIPFLLGTDGSWGAQSVLPILGGVLSGALFARTLLIRRGFAEILKDSSRYYSRRYFDDQVPAWSVFVAGTLACASMAWSVLESFGVPSSGREGLLGFYEVLPGFLFVNILVCHMSSKEGKKLVEACQTERQILYAQYSDHMRVKEILSEAARTSRRRHALWETEYINDPVLLRIVFFRPETGLLRPKLMEKLFSVETQIDVFMAFFEQALIRNRNHELVDEFIDIAEEMLTSNPGFLNFFKKLGEKLIGKLRWSTLKTWRQEMQNAETYHDSNRENPFAAGDAGFLSVEEAVFFSALKRVSKILDNPPLPGRGPIK